MRWDFARAALLGALVSLPVSLALVAMPLSSTADASATDMLLLTNQFRYAVGSPTVPADPRLTQAAQNHANYNSANGILGHFETAGLPYYTGYSARDRLIAQGWTTSFVSEVATGGSELGGVRQLWDAPYHRLGLMHPNATTIGWGHSELNGRQSNVGDIVYNFGIRPVEFVRSPANMQTNIPTSWSGQESPSPVPSGTSGPYGYPIMVVYSAGQNVQFRAAELYGPNGVRLPFYVAPQQFEYDYQVIVPQGPLATNTTYHVRFDITVAGTWLTNEWNFSTGSTISGGGPTSTVPSDNGLHSAWTSQTQMPAMQPASTSQVTLLFRNTGTKTWTRGLAGSQVALGVNGDSGAFSALGMNVGWPSANRVAIQNEVSVGPGAVATFTFTVKAPFSAGTVRIPLRPVVDGVAWLEDQGVFVPVMTVVDYHSRWVSESAFPTLRVGQLSGPLAIAFRNAGSQSWIRGTLGQEARLAVNQDNAQWAALGVNWMSANRVAAQTEATVVPGSVGTFTFQVRAPTTPGLYAIHLRPVIDAVTWMEDEGVFLYITVTN
ncbi:MAG: CAP domain-containing protein [Chloroflexi bacterium]|nr:MAG: CAP domain-containing protein [Chloroflexota bacterium]